MKLKDFLASHETTISMEWYLERFRIWRAKELIASDFTQLVDAPVDKTAWANYRQALRDFPNSPNLSEDSEIPQSPLGGN